MDKNRVFVIVDFPMGYFKAKGEKTDRHKPNIDKGCDQKEEQTKELEDSNDAQKDRSS